METKEDLLYMINRKRGQMLEAAKKHGVSSELALKYSQELDVFIVRYQRLTRSN